MAANPTRVWYVLRPMRLLSTVVVAALVPALGACQELPTDVERFETRCVRLNSVEHTPTPDDPHNGYKTVYACDLDLPAIEAAPPWPDGTLIVKASRRSDQDFPWLVATARKAEGAWSWEEYTRNFASEPLLKIPASETLCTDCHQAVEANDWIFTIYDGGSGGP